MKKIFCISLICLLLGSLLCGCAGESRETGSYGTLPNMDPASSLTTPSSPETSGQTDSVPYTNPPTRARESSSSPVPETQPSSLPGPGESSGTAESPQTQPPTSGPTGKNGYVICVDAGHQGRANTELEPLGPGSEEMKTKVATGTQGRTSGVPEYVVTLQVSLKLQKILEERGYEVLMIRTTHEVNISNAERAQKANEAGVDAFVRIHCNGVDNPEVNGFLAMIQTPNNPWNGSRYPEFKRLAQSIVDEACLVTGAKNMGLLETDGMTGINWCQVPTALVEMGFMTNPQEDLKLVDDAYQDLLAIGIANGIDSFFGIRR
ncbi:MAG: N-acetylmuramoyl-L-alanine amidase [Lachnospiraceae bacterium]|nr:N-acetylmuramoyl-L-alanine amidase [Lachnospiraceae bacterium]